MLLSTIVASRCGVKESKENQLRRDRHQVMKVTIERIRKRIPAATFRRILRTMLIRMQVTIGKWNPQQVSRSHPPREKCEMNFRNNWTAFSWKELPAGTIP